jgi:prepilin-type processing-associated H-X9-DG protein
MTRHRAFTLVELVVAVVLAFILLTIMLSHARKERDFNRRTHCVSNLRFLGTAMIQYIDQYGKGRYYTWPGPQEPSFNGAQWIASMYWVSLLNEPDIYICRRLQDNNDNGGRLGRRLTALRPIDVSYAGRNGMMGAMTEKMPSNTVMMSDDTEGEANHDDGVNLLYFDAHVERSTFISPLATGGQGKPVIGKDKPVDMLRN